MEAREIQLSRLKEELQSHLELEDLDNDLILELTHKIASLDEDRIRFSIDAGVIDRLGQELVARQETAVSELIKNAYDADATHVELSFIDTDQVGGALVIDDNGDGMSREELANGFMRISSTQKIHHPISERFGRQRAGQKGIGRFAVQRLGSKLEIVTQTAESDSALKITVDWDDYLIDNNLLAISNKLEVIDKQKDHGTVITISDLRDKWSKAAIRRTYKYASKIIQPTFPDDIEGNEVENNAKGAFEVSFAKEDNGHKETIADTQLMVYDHAVAVIEGYIEEDTGFGVYSVKSTRLGIDEKDRVGNNYHDIDQPFTKLRNVKFKAYYFIYDNNLITKTHETSIRNLLRKEGGIKLYRNGFRVLPYGESGDDWLDFDRSVRRRAVLFPHGNINFSGLVQIEDTNNIFNETSSREGLIENEEFRELKNFVHRAIMSATNRIASKRGTKALTNQSKTKDGWEDIDFRVKNIALSIEELDELESEDDSSQSKQKRRRKIKKVKQNVIELLKAQKDEEKRMIKERSMLRVLSSVGLTVSQFIHEIKYYMNSIQSDIRYISSDLDQASEAFDRLQILENNFSNFKNYTAYFDDVVSANVVRELYPQNIRRVVKKFVASIDAEASSSNIKILNPIFNGSWLYTKSMHPSEWASILFNLYTNSKKAINRAGSEGQIQIECGVSEDNVYIEFSDNGDGIKKEHEDLIFDEFFTTTAANSFSDLNQNTDYLGTGLGLKIVKDIVRSYRGAIFVASPKNEYKTCLRIEIGKAGDKELSKHGL